MKIYELTLTLNRGWHFEECQRSYHISRAVAKAYAENKIFKGEVETRWSQEFNCYVNVPIPYYEDYDIKEIEVNENV